MRGLTGFSWPITGFYNRVSESAGAMRGSKFFNNPSSANFLLNTLYKGSGYSFCSADLISFLTEKECGFVRSTSCPMHASVRNVQLQCNDSEKLDGTFRYFCSVPLPVPVKSVYHCHIIAERHRLF